VHEGEGVKKYFVSSGSITVNDDSSVQILAEEACIVDQLDAQAVRDGAAKAAQDLISASSEVAKAEAAIALECYDALQKAVDHPWALSFHMKLEYFLRNYVKKLDSRPFGQ